MIEGDHPTAYEIRRDEMVGRPPADGIVTGGTEHENINAVALFCLVNCVGDGLRARATQTRDLGHQPHASATVFCEVSDRLEIIGFELCNMLE